MDKSYLEYPKRGYGHDHEFYDWKPVKKHPLLKWKNDAKLAINLIIPLEFFPLNPSGLPFKHPGAMATPYPDLRHYTVRDYGNRVGIYRILEGLAEKDLAATFAINGEVASRYMPIIQALEGTKHEIAVHGFSTNHLHHENLSESEETSLIKRSIDCFHTPPSGWMSPARNQSSRTLEHLAKANLQYCLDWEMENAPVNAQTSQGLITLLPNNYELSDFTLLHIRKQTEESWLNQIREACEYLITQYDRFGGHTLGLTLTPYIIGQPFRIRALTEFLDYIADHPDIAVMTGHETTHAFRDQI